jgi:translation initiation factor 1
MYDLSHSKILNQIYKLDSMMKRKNKSRMVYSTETGQICPTCGNSIKNCGCGKQNNLVSTDGIVRVRREVKGRRGKTVTVINGVSGDINLLQGLAKEIKQKCGTGGTVKDGEIIIQGDHREMIVSYLQQKGYAVKLSGG